MRIHLVHGIHTSGADQPPEGLIPYLIGATVFYPDYGFELALQTRIANPMIEGAIEPYIQAEDIMIGHSNGCAIIYDLVRHGAPVTGVVLIDAALETDITLPGWVKWCDVYYNQGDTATEAAQIAEELGLVDVVWGPMGHDGYRGTDPRVTNINCWSTPGLPKVDGHSTIFSEGLLKAWGPEILKRILAHLEIPVPIIPADIRPLITLPSETLPPA